jgi:hypothetical protein
VGPSLSLLFENWNSKENWNLNKNWSWNENSRLKRLANNNTTIDGKPIHVIGDFVSSSGGIGKTSVQDGYVEALLTTKIVVVAKRGKWEDHYRLFEGINNWRRPGKDRSYVEFSDGP